ncbi:GGDEF domain-containing protein [Butyrivibrio sp.]|uniref:GGDEF domain-containing protein n=1 Tax=Butyrivibrio sp. TaxID=28121 RepID=UPI0025BFD995|nr:GGDEF domain-containing protein [Butyrivibrio sp.]MBQ9305590.1 GGDEF domain-containing protein [Butyrivibrio sp.]
MWKRAQERFRTRSLIATLILMLIVFLYSTVYVLYVKNYTRDQSYLELKKSTDEAIISIEGEFRADRNMLRLISKIISESGESLHSLGVTRYLNIYYVNSNISEAAILTPRNEVIRISGKDIDATGILDFNSVLEKGEHISTLQRDLEIPSVLDIRSFVPIRKDDRTIAFIYGTTTPAGIIDAWSPEVYNGHGIISIIERDTGKYLIDGKNRINTYFDESTLKLLAISTGETLDENIKSGKSGYAIVRDHSTNEIMYYCYLPMTIANWEMVLSVPEKYVYEAVRPMHIGLYLLIAAEAISLIIYFFYIIHITTGSLKGMERRANMDALTGLQNRNRYEYFCQHLQQGTDGMACIYFDVNGLHELNNTQGHVAGDNMLKTIASIISAEFGENNTYRIGGDEFVAFRYERDEQAVRKDLRRVLDDIEKENYHVASGLAMATPDKKLLTVIKLAEEEMYRDKELYYKSIGKEMRG